MDSETPLACNMNVFTPEQRQAHIQTTTQLFQGVQSVQDVDHGYKFSFPGKAETISHIAEFISNERRCCPFLEFDINIGADDKPVTLALTGPEGTREFLREEFNGAFR